MLARFTQATNNTRQETPNITATNPMMGFRRKAPSQSRRSELDLHTAVVLWIVLRQLPSDRVESRLSLRHA